MAKALLSGPAPDEVVEKRWEICFLCQEVDEKGERLFRMSKKKAFCGLPRSKDVLRDEQKDGCGCNLRQKIKYKATTCPRDKWGEWKGESSDGLPGMQNEQSEG